MTENGSETASKGESFRVHIHEHQGLPSPLPPRGIWDFTRPTRAPVAFVHAGVHACTFSMCKGCM